MTTALLFLVTLFVAYANGANDNSKGVATLFGSDIVSYRAAITLGTMATLAGAVSSVFLAEALVQAFSGKGLVPDAIALSPAFVLAVAAGAGAAVMLATRKGFPISTTHALVGALVGAGFVAAGSALDLRVLGGAFFMPLLLSPPIAFVLATILYRSAQRVLGKRGIHGEGCLCVGATSTMAMLPQPSGTHAGSMALAAPTTRGLQLAVGTTQACVRQYDGRVVGIELQSLLNGLHYLSAAAVSFARGLNDTPKIVGLLLVAHALDIRFGLVAVAVAMAIGGLLNARRVAHTMSKRITLMDERQALVANLVTATLVIFASRFGLPASTTHVSVGAIGGVGVAGTTVNKNVVSGILLSWLLTLPIAACFGAAIYAIGNVIAS